tara:strand:+ start:169 stop:510 length:342 start_codon:yes stop_codon:yes gene_type:complete
MRCPSHSNSHGESEKRVEASGLATLSKVSLFVLRDVRRMDETSGAAGTQVVRKLPQVYSKLVDQQRLYCLKPALLASILDLLLEAQSATSMTMSVGLATITEGRLLQSISLRE